jgi:uncharacterized repeat protein (TIGR01451 family)
MKRNQSQSKQPIVRSVSAWAEPLESRVLLSSAVLSVLAAPRAVEQTPTVAIDAGGPAVGSFAADVSFSGGHALSTSAAIDTSAVTDPAQQRVYQTERAGNFAYTIRDLTPGSSYTVNLDFAEIQLDAADKRLFNVSINGDRVLHKFDVFATAGGENTAVNESFPATANHKGIIAISFTGVKNKAVVSGIELVPKTVATGTSPGVPAAQTDLGVTLTDGKTEVIGGTTDTYTIVVANNGPDADNDVSIDDSWPSNFTGVTYSHTAAGGAVVTHTNGVGTIGDSADMPAGSTITYTATGTVATLTSPSDGSLSDTASVSSGNITDPTPSNNSATDTDTVVQSEADVSVTITDNKTTVAPGSVDTYTIVVTNNGPDSDSDAEITDAWPTDFTGVTYSHTTTGGAVVLHTNGVGGITDSATLPSGSTITYTATGTLSTSASGTLSDTVFAGGLNDPNSSNNTATDTDTITATSATGPTTTSQADLSVTITDNKTDALAGAADTYTIVVTNNGPDADNGADIDDTWPANFTGVAYNYTTTGGAVVTHTNGVGTIGDTADMPAGSTITYTATGTVATLTSPGNGSLSDTVTVIAAGATDPNPSNNSATDTDTVVSSEADLAVTITDNKTSIAPGATDTYTVTVTNNGPDADNGAELADQFPSAFLNPTYSESTTGGAVVLSTHGTGTIGDQLDLPSGSSVTYTVAGTVSSSATGTLSDTETITGATDPNSSNNTATDTDTIT